MKYTDLFYMHCATLLHAHLLTGMKIKIDVCSKLSYSIEVKLSYTIPVVKWIIYQLLYIPPSMQTLRYHEESLENDRTVKSYEIKEHDTIVLMPEGKQLQCKCT